MQNEIFTSHLLLILNLISNYNICIQLKKIIFQFFSFETPENILKKYFNSFYLVYNL